jgi:hypothetical protein
MIIQASLSLTRCKNKSSGHLTINRSLLCLNVGVNGKFSASVHFAMCVPLTKEFANSIIEYVRFDLW